MPMRRRSAPSSASRLCDDRLAEHLDRAAIGRLEPAHQLEQHALAGRRRPDEPELGAALDLERDAGEHVAPAVALVDVVEPDARRVDGHCAPCTRAVSRSATYFESGSSLISAASARHTPAVIAGLLET